MAALCCIGLSAQDKPIDVHHSSISIHVGKAGILSMAGHEHWVEAPISAGVLNDTGPLHVEFTVDTARMTVKPDPKVDAKTQAEIQKDMQEKTLESARFPHITFRSSSVRKQAEGQWTVSGALTLHGITKPITVAVRRSGNAYTGHTTLKQTDFGIKPITAAGGAAKVRNELEIEFQMVATER